jgi:tetratricopeptide (TPR) repeat protein
MRHIRVACAALAAASLVAVAGADTGKRFEWTTKSAEAKTMLKELQLRIENFQGGVAENRALAEKVMAADPGFAMGQYYLSVFNTSPEAAFKEYEKARELAKNASDGERRFIEGMYHVRAVTPDAKKSIEPLEALSRDYPGERLVWVILGQLYANAANDAAKAKQAFLKTQAIGPRTARVEVFLANDELLKGNYAKARAAYQDIEKTLPKGSLPFAIRFGTTFSPNTRPGGSTSSSPRCSSGTPWRASTSRTGGSTRR